MSNNRILGIIANFIQKKSDIYSSNELFGLLSVLLLIQISDIFKTNSSLQQNDQAAANNFTGLLNQLDNNNLQQMLPMLMGALGGNSNLNMNNIANMLKNLNTGKISPQDNNQEEYDNEEELENTQGTPNKKKVVGR